MNARQTMLRHRETLRLPVLRPFDARHTFWKPSHFATGLEAHTARESLRTFRIDGLVCGVVMRDAKEGIEVEVFSDGEWDDAKHALLVERIVRSYGLDEDPAPFLRLASATPIEDAVAAMPGMRQSCPEDVFEIAIVALLLQNSSIARTTQMMRNLLDHHGCVAHYAGVALKAFFTPAEICEIAEAEFRERDRIGYRAKYLVRFAEYFAARDPRDLCLLDRADLLEELQTIRGVGPYTSAIIASHALRDSSAIGFDSWNRKIVALRFLGASDASEEAVMACLTSAFPGYEGMAALYAVEDLIRRDKEAIQDG